MRGGRFARRAHLVLSNPDMVHSGILPHHPRWAKLFENLRYVVIDELHAYRGVFGSHLCNVLRRLRRICRHYGSDPVFICSSATIANPRELAERLTEQPFELVGESGAPRGEKFFVFVNPPVVNHQLGIRRSYLAETRRIASEFLKRNLQLIVFAQSRLSTEILTTYLKDDFEGEPGAPRADPRLSRRLSAASGGARSRRGCARARCAPSCRPTRSSSASTSARSTSAVMAGYPGTIAATWQRAGRAGRRAEPVGGGDGGEQRAARSVRRPQPVVLLRRVARARARSIPTTCTSWSITSSARRSSCRSAPTEAFGRHGCAGDPRRAGGAGARAPRPETPSEASTAVDLDERVVSGRRGQPAVGVVGQLRHRRHDATRRASSARPISRAGRPRCTRRRSTSSKGSCIQVERLDFEGRKAFVREIDCDYYTDAITYTRVTILDTFAERRTTAAPALARRSPRRLARRRVQEDQVLHERERRLGRARSARAADAHDVVLADDSGGGDGALPYASDDRRDGVVGLAFAMRQVAQLLLMCDGHDIGISIDDGERQPRRPRVGGSGAISTSRAIFIYDNYPGGIGFSAPLFGMHDELLDATRAADRRVRVRERLSRLRRPDRQHRPAGEGGGAARSSICCSAG